MESTNPAIRAVFEASKKPAGGFLDIFILLMPLLEQLFQSLIENCASTEDQAVALFANPRDFQVTRAENLMRRRLRRQRDFRRLSRREQRQFVNNTLVGVNDTAVDRPELIRAAYQSVNA